MTRRRTSRMRVARGEDIPVPTCYLEGRTSGSTSVRCERARTIEERNVSIASRHSRSGASSPPSTHPSYSSSTTACAHAATVVISSRHRSGRPLANRNAQKLRGGVERRRGRRRGEIRPRRGRRAFLLRDSRNARSQRLEKRLDLLVRLERDDDILGAPDVVALALALAVVKVDDGKRKRGRRRRRRRRRRLEPFDPVAVEPAQPPLPRVVPRRVPPPAAPPSTLAPAAAP
eukprot:30895-Pelagococcus_subviridis.AAC.6